MAGWSRNKSRAPVPPAMEFWGGHRRHPEAKTRIAMKTSKTAENIIVIELAKNSIYNPSMDLRALPHSPGVYLMRDRSGQILYVGKARDLAKRVGSYFVNRSDHSAKIAA